MNELDEILLDQYQSAQRRKKMIKKMKKLMPFEKQLDDVESANQKRIIFFENYISDKTMLCKKAKKKKEYNDILAKNSFYECYRQVTYTMFFGYKLFTDSALQYLSFFKKDKNDKTKS